MTALLEVKDVKVRFGSGQGLLGRLGFSSGGSIEAVAGISFSLQEGETYGIVGESGSGKTTLARAIGGLHHAQEGSILFQGADLRGLAEAQFRGFRKDIAMMFQDPIGSLSPRLTIKSLLTEPYRIQGLKDRDLEAEAKRLLAMVGLPADFAGRFPHQLSGGQARRIGVARALALDPKLILADEPTAGLDVSVQGELLNLLARLQDKLGLSIIIITHNLNVVRHITDRMGIMYLGRFVEEGRTDDIFAQPQHPYTLALLAANPEPDPDAQLARIELKGEPPSLIQRPLACEFHPRCPFVRDNCRTGAPPGWQSSSEVHSHRCHWPADWQNAEA
ncbi:ABC transporter ATP-binding protein [Pelagibius sp. Alg239-R121]|uniref:oligopeptide/dipeptide ABC transporter ATP-binding protein n=1 Tax=Pelagibius sp. Alg239-R121 TaxID=2993448 RepID=UPI0024A61816|nr:ABC transporter ATP-binding protein [Pelagibius sp. Alg239-R121]